MDELEKNTEGGKTETAELLERIQNASMILADWDGYYDPKTGKGSTKGLAEVIELAYIALQGESWRKENE